MLIVGVVSAGLVKVLLVRVSVVALPTKVSVAVGTNGFYLAANSATATGLQWTAITTDPTPTVFMLMGA